jgi:hypothetical protein
LEKVWKQGHVDVGELTFQSAAYVAGYVTDKVTGQKAEDYYKWISLDGEEVVINPPFALMSRGRKKGEGIGAGYYEKYKSDFWPHDKSSVPGQEPVWKVPRYYEELLKAEDEALLEEIKEKRQKFRRENSEEYTPERLMAKYRCTKARKELFGGKKL